MLDFINENVAWRTVGWKPRSDFPTESYGIAAKKKVIGFEIYFNYMVGGDSAIEQMLFENGEKEKAFPATAHPNENLYQVVAFCLNKAIEQQFALNYHCRSFPLCLHVDLFESGEIVSKSAHWVNANDFRVRFAAWNTSWW